MRLKKKQKNIVEKGVLSTKNTNAPPHWGDVSGCVDNLILPPPPKKSQPQVMMCITKITRVPKRSEVAQEQLSICSPKGLNC